MGKRLLIVGAGSYALLAYEIACDMGEFERIDFVDDCKEISPTGGRIVGKSSKLAKLAKEYTDVIVAIGSPEIRLRLLDQIRKETALRIATLVSPRAYIAPSAKIGDGCIIEPFAAVHTLCKIQSGCIISAGAVINHESVCEAGVHVDCNATVPGYTTVPAGAKIPCGTVYADRISTRTEPLH